MTTLEAPPLEQANPPSAFVAGDEAARHHRAARCRECAPTKAHARDLGTRHPRCVWC